MQIFKLLLQSSKSLFILAAVTGVLSGLCSAVVTTSIVESLAEETPFDAHTFILRFGIYWIGYGVFAIVSSYSVVKLTQGVIHKLRLNLSNKILNSNFQVIESNQSKIFPILTEDIKTIAHGIERMPSVTTGIATVVGVLGYVVWSSPELTGVVMVLFGLVFFITKLSLPYIRKYQENSRNLWNDLFKHFEGLVYGIKELSLNKEFNQSYIKDIIEPVSKTQNAFMVKESTIIAVSSKMGDLVLLLGMAVLVVVSFQTDFIQPSEFNSFLTLILFIIAPLTTITGWFSNLKRVEVALDQLHEVGLTLEKPKLIEDKILDIDPIAPLLKFDAVYHEYYSPDKDQHFELGPINLDIRQGELIFLLGGNGSGKTTLAKMIVGLYAAKKGEIYYHGSEVTEAYISDYRSKFSATFVDSYIFDNLMYLGEETIKNKGEELLQKLELTKKVKIENGKFSTVRLSEGQKKRLGLLVTILEDKDIYLFDEWAANQDPYFKKIFYDIILQDLKTAGKTVIVISHDEQYFDRGDRVIKLIEGKLV